jgi:CheY-like chemotaxis protein
VESYINYDPSEVSHEKLEEFGQDFTRLFMQSSSDSVPNIAITHEEGMWQIDISLKYSRGHIGVRRTGEDLEVLMSDVLEEFSEKIKIWRTQREIDFLGLDNSTEYDLFSTFEGCHTSETVLPEKLEKPQILVVEDDPTASAMIDIIFRKFGCDVDVARSPSEGTQKFLKKEYDLLVLDWNLPYQNADLFLNSLERRVQSLKKRGAEKKSIPVVLCSGMSLENYQFPDFENFYLKDKWFKGLPFSSTLQSIEKVVESLKKNREEGTNDLGKEVRWI